jgi:hypothetical protein
MSKISANSQEAIMFLENTADTSFSSRILFIPVRFCLPCGVLPHIHVYFIMLNECSNKVQLNGGFVMRQAFGCPRCGLPTAAGQGFCGNCGFALSTNCPRCGAYVSPGDRFCENCGASVCTVIMPGQSVPNPPQTVPVTQQHQYTPISLQHQASVAVPVRKSTFRVASVFLLIASIMLMVSPSLVWFRAKTTLFGISMPAISVKGSELGDVSSLLNMIGTSLLARGEYIIVLGALVLILTIISFFVLKGRKLIAAIIGIAAVVCLLIGTEATMKLMDESTALGEGIFLMFGSSLILLIGSFKLP